MKIDLSTYTTIEQLEADIKDIKIQGATNVALATLKGLEIAVSMMKGVEANELDDIVKIGERLANARPNEPLARNAVKYFSVKLAQKKASFTKDTKLDSVVSQIISDYLNLGEEIKKMIVKNGAILEKGVSTAFTHCHSSTVENILIDYGKKKSDFRVFCTETRPLMQGRITATNLINARIDTTLLVDSAAESIIIGRGNHNVDVVFTGVDEITIHGDAINKIGSFGIALAAYYASKPIYVVSSLLKVCPNSAYEHVEIETRSTDEIWADPPKGLKIYNPAFEIIPAKLITGYLTEIGIVKPEEMAKALHDNYDWVF